MHTRVNIRICVIYNHVAHARKNDVNDEIDRSNEAKTTMTSTTAKIQTSHTRIT